MFFNFLELGVFKISQTGQSLAELTELMTRSNSGNKTEKIENLLSLGSRGVRKSSAALNLSEILRTFDLWHLELVLLAFWGRIIEKMIFSHCHVASG